MSCTQTHAQRQRVDDIFRAKGSPLVGFSNSAEGCRYLSSAQLSSACLKPWNACPFARVNTCRPLGDERPWY
jgi:hypothetical protein